MQDINNCVFVDDFERISFESGWSKLWHKLLSMSINENTQVKLSFVLAVLSLFLAGILGIAWWSASWTSTVSVKLDVILQQQTANNNQVQNMQVQLFELRKDFELHKAATGTILPK